MHLIRVHVRIYGGYKWPLPPPDHTTRFSKISFFIGHFVNIVQQALPTMRICYALFTAALVAPVAADVYFKEQFNDDVSLSWFDLLGWSLRNFAMLATWKLDIEKDRCGYGFLHNDVNWGLNGPLSHLIICKIWECLGMMTAYIHTKWQLSHFFHHRIVFFTHTHTGMERPMDRLIWLEI